MTTITRKRFDNRWIYFVDISDMPYQKIDKYIETVRDLIELYTELKDEDIAPHTNS